MTYKFKSVPRRVYPKTFLKDVQLSIFYPQQEICVEQKGNVIQFFKQTFGVPFDVSDLDKGIAVSSTDNQIKCEFTFSRLKLTIRQLRYKSFNFISGYWFDIFRQYLNIIDVKEVSKVFLSKYNELEFQRKEGQINAEELLNLVFSKDLLESSTTEMKDFQNTVRWEAYGEIKGDDDTDSTFSYEYGYRINTENTTKGMVTLKTSVSSSEVHLTFEQVCEVLLYYNQILFDGYHWCVTESIVKNMC